MLFLSYGSWRIIEAFGRTGKADVLRFGRVIKSLPLPCGIFALGLVLIIVADRPTIVSNRHLAPPVA